MSSPQSDLSPPPKKMRLLGPEGGGGAGVESSEWGRLWELATEACRLAEEEEEELLRRNSHPYKKLKTGHPMLMGWVDKAVLMGGRRPRLVVKKTMSKTDLDPYFGRLPLPSVRRANPSRGGVQLLLRELSAAENLAIEGAGLPITVLDRWGREYVGATLKLWAEKWYVITGGSVWRRVVVGNALKTGDVVEVFSFRAPPDPRPPTARTKNEDGRGGHTEEGSSRLVLVVSVGESSIDDGERRRQQDEEEHHRHWSAATIPRKPRT